MSKNIKVKVGNVELDGILNIPKNVRGVILFAHGSGSGRFSPRNQAVAKALARRRFGSLLLDLLTKEEEVVDEQTGELRFDIEFLGKRLIGVSKWLEEFLKKNELDVKIGYFGASTGAAAALIASVKFDVFGIVSRGGRPDLAGNYLEKVSAPVLLIVGGEDKEVLELNRQAFEKLRAKKSLKIVEGAGHLFEEEGAMTEVSDLAGQWFARCLE